MGKKNKKKSNNISFPENESSVMSSTDMTGAIPTPPKNKDEQESLDKIIRTDVKSR